MSRIQTIVDQIQLARKYTEGLLDGVRAEDWFRMPAEGITHIAWQVGHIAVAQYYLTMKRIRGARTEDAELVSDEWMGLFGKGSTPQADASVYPGPEAIRETFDRVHEQAVRELSGTDDGVLDEPTDPPHPMFATKLGAVQFCPYHEMLHAGQIGLLRRLFGSAPLR
jgi:hypothetical protein